MTPPRARTIVAVMRVMVLFMSASESCLVSDAENALVDAQGLVTLVRQPGLHDQSQGRDVGDCARYSPIRAVLQAMPRQCLAAAGQLARGGRRGNLPAVTRQRHRGYAIAVGDRRAAKGAGVGG